jgi:uncharacterized protein YfaQ (DUF2300 family)
LAKSCGRYFEPARLAIDAADWRHHWRSDDPAAAWLTDLGRLAPQTELAPVEILAALETVTPAARQAARRALLAVLLEGYGANAWPELGTGFRFKTFSWHDLRGRALGGGAGWLADGTPVWFGGPGASRNVLDRYATRLATALPAPNVIDEEAAACVDVRFFARYPIHTVLGETNGALASGTMSGAVKVEFENGSRLTIHPSRQLELRTETGRPVIRGRFPLDAYVARVIDREGSAAKPQAARALAVAARTYVLQRGLPVDGCLAIDDDSRSQRVSPNPPSEGALAAARFTEDLTLRVPVRYHRDKPAANVLSWKRATELADQGVRFDAILSDAFGSAAFGAIQRDGDCRRLADAETWLGKHSAAWRGQLRRQAGYEAPPAITVCALPHGNPYSDQGRNRIYVRDWMSAQGRLALTHEYVHLAFRFHPSGEDEAFVERAARALESGVQP